MCVKSGQAIGIPRPVICSVVQSTVYKDANKEIRSLFLLFNKVGIHFIFLDNTGFCKLLLFHKTQPAIIVD